MKKSQVLLVSILCLTTLQQTTIASQKQIIPTEKLSTPGVQNVQKKINNNTPINPAEKVKINAFQAELKTLATTKNLTIAQAAEQLKGIIKKYAPAHKNNHKKSKKRKHHHVDAINMNQLQVKLNALASDKNITLAQLIHQSGHLAMQCKASSKPATPKKR